MQFHLSTCKIEQKSKYFEGVLRMGKKVFIISHTHWDREWYQTFQGYRKRLVYLIDQLIETMEKDNEYKFFHFDGQTIVLEDYLEIRPENKDRFKKLIKDGRIIIGPWYVMPDEFLVSGESLVKNINIGMDICDEYNADSLKVGYVTDIFGHNNQFPQILKGFGINTALLYRGIGNYPKDGFIWEAVDGSKTLVHKLDSEMCYSNFYLGFRKLIENKEFTREDIKATFNKLLEFLSESATSENILMMDGVDHIEIEPRLPGIIDILREEFKDVQFEHTTLESYFQNKVQGQSNLETIHGELYEVGKEGGVNQVIKNVLSSTVHLKQMNNRCETDLSRIAGALDIIANIATDNANNAKGFIDRAWKFIIENHPHDSICGCSISQVHRENEYRFGQAGQIIDEVINYSKRNICANINSISFNTDKVLTIFNFSEQQLDEIAVVDIAFENDDYGNFVIHDESINEIPFQLLNSYGGAEFKHTFGRLPEFPYMHHKIIAIPVKINGIGWCSYGIKKLTDQFEGFEWKVHNPPIRNVGTMLISSNEIDNGPLLVTIHPNGTLSVKDNETGRIHDNLLYFESCGDYGDGWFYRKPIREERAISLNSVGYTRIQNDGVLVTELDITTELLLPKSLTNKETDKLVINTNVIIRRNSRRIDFKTTVDNKTLNHRLRVLFDTNLETDTFHALTPFYMTKRDIKMDSKKDYVEIETFVSPNQGVVCLKDDNGTVGLYNKGLYEVEIKDNAKRTVALTLFRSITTEVGGKHAEVGSQIRNMTFDYALELANPEIKISEITSRGLQFKTGLITEISNPITGKLMINYSFLSIDEPGIIISTIESTKEKNTILRLYNSTDDEKTVTITMGISINEISLLDLRGTVVKGVIKHDKNSFQIKFKKGEIISLKIESDGVKE